MIKEKLEKNKVSKEEAKKHIKRMREKDSELVTGIFTNLENRAGNGSLGILKFNFKKYEEDEPVTYEFNDGQQYTIPRGVARHLNNNCYYTEYEHLPGQTGSNGIRAAYNDGRLASKIQMTGIRKVHRCKFTTNDFMDDDPQLYPADITEVTIGLKDK